MKTRLFKLSQIYAAISIILFSALPVFSQNLQKTGTTAAQFLKIDVGPRAIGMGGAYIASATDINAVYWNPAGLASLTGNGEAVFNHINWFADIKLSVATAALMIPEFGTVAVSFSSLNAIEDEPVRTEVDPTGSGELFDAGGLSFGLSYARNLTDRFSIGFNAKYIQESIWHSTATGFAFDMGVLYRINILNEFRMGASVFNFGSKMKMDGRDVLEIISVGSGDGNLISAKYDLDSFDLPLLFRVGVAADLIKEGHSRLTLAFDAVHPNDHTEYVNSGVEYSLNEQAFLRFGYKSLFEKDTEQGLTFGAGVLYGLGGDMKIKIDYAYQDFGVLDIVHHVAFGVSF
ncbi:MAG: PorV/PorQ family protein [Calditrichae bacterium]|nr:PorV/PorQ family protein [Calditrichota bacterium]MCB9057336.1 PorV/PorQ family protein [Calditrichia bacterium]